MTERKRNVNNFFFGCTHQKAHDRTARVREKKKKNCSIHEFYNKNNREIFGILKVGLVQVRICIVQEAIALAKL